MGTQNIADACIRNGVGAMVLISTDKAVNPHNVMGTTKRCAEAYCQALDAQGGSTRFVAVRFGNVLGSAGSVVPLFQRQLATGGPITVTHPDISRYFMTIPEAVALVIQASALGATSSVPRGQVYVLDMGKPIKIADLARKMIRLSGKEPDRDIEIVYIGLRPGEKLHEEIVHEEENFQFTDIKSVMMVSPRTSELGILQHQFGKLARATEELDEARCLRLLGLIVPEFNARERTNGASGKMQFQKLVGE
jgi:O-antigen biosynthesis protein WbqV